VIGIQFSAVALVRAAALQQQHVTPADSVIVESPLPGGVAAVTRFLLNTVPAWLQISGLVVAAIVGIFVLWYVFSRRRTIQAWLSSRARGIQLAIAALAMALVAAIVGMGSATWNYTQHSNGFCTGCHVMNPAFQKFGNTENKHGELSCHACHQQSVGASVRQLYLWIAERPEKIGPHSKVPNRVCETCHVTGDTATWQRVAATAGHRVHLESDSSALKGLQCVKCHGVEVHRFRPVKETCGQSGCHEPNETAIVLGKMATQTVRHCTTCHAFTADVPALATRDSARGTLVPGQQQCFGCHEMRQVLADFDAARDPHGGKCGTCHDPHEQKTPADARATCATAACHGNWRNDPFHVGPSHKAVGAQCLTCHRPHQAKLDASDCVGCHASVRSRGRLQPPLPFDTTTALRRADIPAAPRPPNVMRPPARHASLTGPAPDDATLEEADDRSPLPEMTARPPNVVDSRHGLTRAPPAAADSFPHARHAAKLACLTCHQTGPGHGRLTFEPPRGCAICHHQAPAQAQCASCHQTEKYATPKNVTVTVKVAGREPHARPVDFLHARHVSRACVECHTTPVTLAPSPDAVQCKDCHGDHHTTGRDCSVCHANADPKSAHKTPETAHQRCDACHTSTTIARLTPTRSLCITCHVEKATKHHEEKECTICHFLAEPAAYRSKLTTSSR